MSEEKNSDGPDSELLKAIIEFANSDLVFSDLMLQEKQPIRARTPAGLVTLGDGFFEVTKAGINGVLSAANPQYVELVKKGVQVSFGKDLTNCRLRVTAYSSDAGKKLCMTVRRISLKPMSLDEIGLTSLDIMMQTGNGLILVTGPTGSGKSTTLAAAADHFNQNEHTPRHIVTIEDPIEYVHQPNKCMFSQREIGIDVMSFAKGVEEALRQRPDVIIIGEVLDADTAAQALRAAATGVLVICTLHANDAAGAVQNMINFFPDNERDAKTSIIAANLRGVVNQLLLPHADKSAKEGWILAPEIMFNNQQQVSKFVGSYDKLRDAMTNNSDKSQRSMVKSLVSLVAAEKVDKGVALRAVSGEVQYRLQAELDKLANPSAARG